MSHFLGSILDVVHGNDATIAETAAICTSSIVNGSVMTCACHAASVVIDGVVVEGVDVLSARETACVVVILGMECADLELFHVVCTVCPLPFE